MLAGILLLWLLFKPDTSFYYTPASLFMIIFLVVVLFQCIPLPMNMIRLLSSKTAVLYDKFLPAGSPAQWHTLSTYVFATQEKLVELVTLFSIFFITINITKTKQQVKRFITFCVGIAVFLSLYAAAKGHFLSDSSLAGFGLFSNRNYYAGYTLLVSFLCLGYGFSFKELSKRIFFLFLSGVLMIGVVISISRAAIMNLFFWLCVMMLWFIQQKLFTKKQIVTFMLLVTIFMTLYFTIVDPQPLLTKLDTTSRSLAGRFSKYSAAFSMVKDFPFLGVGLGNYRYVHTQYSSLGMMRPDPNLHSDPLQLIAESGIVGGIFFCLFFVFLFKDIIIQLYKRHDPFVKYIVPGGLCGIFALTSHSFVEVLFPIPAVAVMFWFILALVY
jgi:O-antigen ligase